MEASMEQEEDTLLAAKISSVKFNETTIEKHKSESTSNYRASNDPRKILEDLSARLQDLKEQRNESYEL